MILATEDRIEEARELIAEMKRKWPESPDEFFKQAEFTVDRSLAGLLLGAGAALRLQTRVGKARANQQALMSWTCLHLQTH